MKKLSSYQNFQDTAEKEELVLLITPAQRDPAILLEAILDSCTTYLERLDNVEERNLKNVKVISNIEVVVETLLKHLEYIVGTGGTNKKFIRAQG